ncbi:hypothetical protein KAJ27_09080 [bacterium]|nr:hypothetical protein [bacterium]
MFKIKSRFLVIFFLTLVFTFAGVQGVQAGIGEILTKANGFIIEINSKLDLALNIETQIMSKINNALDMSNITNLVDNQLGLLGSQNKYAKKALDKMGDKFDINALLQDKLPPSLKESIIKKLGIQDLFDKLEPIKEQIRAIKDKIAVIQVQLNKVNAFYNKMLAAVDEINGFFNQLGSKKGLFGVLRKFTKIPIVAKFFSWVEKLKGIEKKILGVKFNAWEAIKTASEIVSWVVSIYTGGGLDVATAALGAMCEGIINALLETLMEKIQDTVWTAAGKLLEGDLDSRMNELESGGIDAFSALRDGMKEVFKDPIDWDELLSNLAKSPMSAFK